MGNVAVAFTHFGVSGKLYGTWLPDWPAAWCVVHLSLWLVSFPNQWRTSHCGHLKDPWPADAGLNLFGHHPNEQRVSRCIECIEQCWANNQQQSTICTCEESCPSLRERADSRRRGWHQTIPNQKLVTQLPVLQRSFHSRFGRCLISKVMAEMHSRLRTCGIRWCFCKGWWGPNTLQATGESLLTHRS